MSDPKNTGIDISEEELTAVVNAGDTAYGITSRALTAFFCLDPVEDKSLINAATNSALPQILAINNTSTDLHIGQTLKIPATLLLEHLTQASNEPSSAPAQALVAQAKTELPHEPEPQPEAKVERREPESIHAPIKYKIGTAEYTMTPDVYDALKAVEERTDGLIPFQAMAAIVARESSMNPESINASSGAVGLFQFMTNKVGTLYEVTYKFAEEYGYPEAKELVTRDRIKSANGDIRLDYRPVDEAAKQQLIEEFGKDPAFNAAMWEAYTIPKIEHYNDFLGTRNISGMELTLMNNIGHRGLEKFFTQVMRDKSQFGDDVSQGMTTSDFFEKHRRLFGGHVSANKTLLFHPDGSDKTVRESYNDLKKFGGYDELEQVREAQKQMIASTSFPHPGG